MRITRHIFTLMAAALLTLGSTTALARDREVDIYDLSLDDNLETPEISKKKHAERVQDYQYETAVKLKKQNYDVELMRDDEVIVVTLPASQLFASNDTVLSAVGRSSIKPLLSLLNNPGFYKMLLVMHSDNTGSDKYTVGLTRARVNAVYDWIDENASVDYVVPYALGATDPVVDNNSVDNRKRNRRLEIYIVPEKVMIEQAKKGNININRRTSR